MTKPVIYVIFYSTYGHVKKLAESIVKGITESGVAEAKLFRVAETLSDDILQKMHAVKFDDVPVITAADLEKADGFLFGLPTRFGNAPAQMKAFWDSTGGLWAKGALVGKFAGIFTSTASQHGGLETTALTFLPNLVHHGIIYVPLGFSHPSVASISEVHGASAWGSGTIANGDGSRQPSAVELEIAQFQGKSFAQTVARSHKK